MKNVLGIATIFAMVGLFATSCASTDQQDEQGAYEEANGNYEDGEELNNAGGNEFADNVDNFGGEQINNDSGNEFAEQGEEFANQQFNNEFDNSQELQLNQQQAQGNNALIAGNNLEAEEPSLENLAAGNQNALALQAANGGNEILPEAGNFVDGGPEDAAANLPPTTGGQVFYVRSQVVATNQPGGGAAIGSFEKGDHPVVWPEAEFGKTSDGGFIPMSGLTDQPVGRERRENRWRVSGR